MTVKTFTHTTNGIRRRLLSVTSKRAITRKLRVNGTQNLRNRYYAQRRKYLHERLNNRKQTKKLTKLLMNNVAVTTSMRSSKCSGWHGIGDDLKTDKLGANAVGIDRWLLGIDVKTFSEMQTRILNQERANPYHIYRVFKGRSRVSN